ncbi:hypothetical protein CYMTET_10606 [Cymbomonas tetramitiformis]|uniref:HECT-type E3 ubiquitin transferase n=1 Tax=Cymbomonas tetramitiformis TaxID=36881 RepID=A0AAE0LDN8_9CHLO|nr:hypothetical protein CYMTET_10606 [Cymbomonas tetramitiformis]
MPSPRGPAQASLHLCGKRIYENRTSYLPAKDNRELHTFRMIGRILVKSIIDRRPIPMRLAPSVFKYLLGIRPTLRDLELYDRTLATTLREVLLRPAGNLHLFLGEDQRPVTDSNKAAYVHERVWEVLVGCREQQLRAVKEGFEEVDLCSYIQVFTCADLMLLVCGDEHIHPNMVINLLSFNPVDWPSRSCTPSHLCEVIQEMEPNELRRFLQFVTSQGTIIRGTCSPLNVQMCPTSNRLPVGRTCFRRLDLPDYENIEVLRQKLKTALSAIDDAGFGMV